MATTVNGQWGYAVPLDGGIDGANDEMVAHPPPRSRNDRYGSQDSGTASLRQMKGNVSKRPSNKDMQAEAECNRSRRPSAQSGNGSLVGKKRSHNALKSAARLQEESPTTMDEGSAWIHRDKLAQIESRELEEAGYIPRQSRGSGSAGPGASRRASSRSESRSGKRSRAVSRDRASLRSEDDGYGNAEYGGNGRKRVSTIPAADEEEQEQERAYDSTTDHELRTPEEVAAEHLRQQQRQYLTQPQQTIRPSTSRLPMPKNSPAPISQAVVERDSPVPRSRNGSGAISANWAELANKRRSRSQSINSAVLINEDRSQPQHYTPSRSRPNSSYQTPNPDNLPENSPPPTASPQKARLPSKPAPTSGVRKTPNANGSLRSPSSAGTGGHKPRTRSTGTHQKRPSSSYGGNPRPSTSSLNRPEGDAPWIATMYKPDPRLPPEQQMLPTHAKRLAAQERGEDSPEPGSGLEAWELDGGNGMLFVTDNGRQPSLSPSPSPSPTPRPTAGLEKNRASLVERVPSQHATLANETAAHWPISSGNALTPTTELGSKPASLKSNNPSPRPDGGYRITPNIPETSTSTAGGRQYSYAHSANGGNVTGAGAGHGTGKTMGVPQLDLEEAESMGRGRGGVQRMPEGRDEEGGKGGGKKKGGCGGCCVVM